MRDAGKQEQETGKPVENRVIINVCAYHHYEYHYASCMVADVSVLMSCHVWYHRYHPHRVCMVMLVKLIMPLQKWALLA